MLLRIDTREMTELEQAFELAASNVAANRPIVLRALAVQNLTWAMRDFRDKSRGQRGGDGVQWSPIQAETVRNRLRKLKAYRKARESVDAAKLKLRVAIARHKTAAKIAKREGRQIPKLAQKQAARVRRAYRRVRSATRAMDRARREMSFGTKLGKAKVGKAAIERAKWKHEIAQRKFKKAKTWTASERRAARRELNSAKRRVDSLQRQAERERRGIQAGSRRVDKAAASRTKLIERLTAGAKIGIDTGRLANSLVSGIREIRSGEPFKPAPGNSEPVPPALLELDAFGFTVGTAVKYAKWFDQERAIFGIGFHSPQRIEAMSQLAARAHAMAAMRAANKQNPNPATETELKDDSTE